MRIDVLLQSCPQCCSPSEIREIGRRISDILVLPDVRFSQAELFPSRRRLCAEQQAWPSESERRRRVVYRPAEKDYRAAIGSRAR